MNNALKILIFISAVSASQNENFLTKLFLDSVEISNQEFDLKLAGVINLKAQQIGDVNDTRDSYYYDNNISYITEILSPNDIRIAHQKKHTKELLNQTVKMNQELKNQLESQCSWNWSGNNTNLNMVLPNDIDFFPTFSFLRGKLLTIKNNNNNTRDYLFSLTKSEGHINYGNKHLSFNLTDDDEKGYIINTIIIDDDCFIYFNQAEMEKLNFETKFINQAQFSLSCDYSGYYGNRESTRNIKATLGKDTYSCECSCAKDYLTIYRNQDHYMEKSITLNDADLIYLFKLVEKKY